MPKPPPVDVCRRRLIDALHRFKVASSTEHGYDPLEERRARISCGYWRKMLKAASREPYQKALDLEAR